VTVVTFLTFEAVTSRAFWQLSKVARWLGTFAFIGLCVIPIALPYLKTQQTFHFHWDMQTIRDFSAAPSDYLSASTLKLFTLDFLRSFQNATFPAEHALFPGFATLLLALLALMKLGSRWPDVWARRVSCLPRASGRDRDDALGREVCRYLAI